ncbi:japanin-like-RA2 [Rhipicephalus microplus]|uniref:japanin-like-RA2 n=1 Tax=Rhipicephalus microplus TaxID=6941 RepID=UPI003F6A562E
MNVTVTCELRTKVRAKSQYLMFYQTWNDMLLTELIESIQKKPMCSIWAKHDHTENVDPTTLAYFYAVCNDPVYTKYPSYCPKNEK